MWCKVHFRWNTFGQAGGVSCRYALVSNASLNAQSICSVLTNIVWSLHNKNTTATKQNNNNKTATNQQQWWYSNTDREMQRWRTLLCSIPNNIICATQHCANSSHNISIHHPTHRDLLHCTDAESIAVKASSQYVVNSTLCLALLEPLVKPLFVCLVSICLPSTKIGTN